MLDWHGAAFKSLNTHGKEYNTHNLSLFCRSTGYLNFPYLCPLYYFSLCIIDEKQKTQFFFFFLLIDCLVNRDIHCGYHLSTGQLTCHSRPILCSTLAVPSVPVDWNTHTHMDSFLVSLCCSWLFCVDHLIVYPGPNGYQEDERENISRPVRNRLVMIVIIM